MSGLLAAAALNSARSVLGDAFLEQLDHMYSQPIGTAPRDEPSEATR